MAEDLRTGYVEFQALATALEPAGWEVTGGAEHQDKPEGFLVLRHRIAAEIGITTTVARVGTRAGLWLSATVMVPVQDGQVDMSGWVNLEAPLVRNLFDIVQAHRSEAWDRDGRDDTRFAPVLSVVAGDGSSEDYQERGPE